MYKKLQDFHSLQKRIQRIKMNRIFYQEEKFQKDIEIERGRENLVIFS